MAVEGFPLFDLDWFSYQIVVDGTTFQFEFRYSQRATCWYWDVFDIDGTPLQTGTRVITAISLDYQNLFEGLPMFVRLDGKPNSPDPDQADFPNEVAFLYATGDDALAPPLDTFLIIENLEEV
jgi:hypothetical protein